jgi:hypothetical protein
MNRIECRTAVGWGGVTTAVHRKYETAHSERRFNLKPLQLTSTLALKSLLSKEFGAFASS